MEYTFIVSMYSMHPCIRDEPIAAYPVRVPSLHGDSITPQLDCPVYGGRRGVSRASGASSLSLSLSLSLCLASLSRLSLSPEPTPEDLIFFFFFTLVTEPGRSLILQLSDTESL